MTTTDGALQPATTALTNAITALINPQPHTIKNQLHWLDSRYDQLQDSIGGNQGQSHTQPRSIPLIWADAVDQLKKIDTQVKKWQPDSLHDDTDTPPTVRRLRLIQQRKWRPQDVRDIEDITANIQAWNEKIDDLLNPLPAWTLPNPCPACNTTTVYHTDSTGERIRKPALQIKPHGCECQNCHYNWSPAYFSHLAAVLGYPLPAGVLE
jgi:hypothetical protein